MIWIVLLLFAGLAALPYILESRRRPVRAELYSEAPGDFARLTQGITHFQWIGPARGPVVIAVHGLTTPSPAWYEVANQLARHGFRVMLYDLYGRGYSDSVPGPQTREFFLTQLEDLLHEQQLEQELTLMGYSMGGSIVTAFASKHPDRVKQIALVASAGIETKESDFSRFCRKVPVLGDWVHGVFAVARLERGIKASSLNAQQKSMQSSELLRRGYLPAVLSSRRGILQESMEADHRKISNLNIPVLAVWAQDDPVIPIQALGTLVRWNRLARQETVARAGHEVPMSHGETVADLIQTMISEP